MALVSKENKQTPKIVFFDTHVIWYSPIDVYE